MPNRYKQDICIKDINDYIGLYFKGTSKKNKKISKPQVQKLINSEIANRKEFEDCLNINIFRSFFLLTKYFSTA